MWEYKTAWKFIGDPGRSDLGAQPQPAKPAIGDEIESGLNTLGADGWELVSAHQIAGWLLGLFKRPVV